MSDSPLAKMKCQRCKRRGVRVGVNLFLDIPVRLYAGLSKSCLRDKDVLVKGAGWDRCYFYCPKCGWSTHLTEIELLRNKVAFLEKCAERKAKGLTND